MEIRLKVGLNFDIHQLGDDRKYTIEVYEEVDWNEFMVTYKGIDNTAHGKIDLSQTELEHLLGIEGGWRIIRPPFEPVKLDDDLFKI